MELPLIYRSVTAVQGLTGFFKRQTKYQPINYRTRYIPII